MNVSNQPSNNQIQVLLIPKKDTFFANICLFSSRIIENITEFDETVVQSERLSAIKPSLIHHFLHLKMPEPSQEYDSSCPFVFYMFCHLNFLCD